MFASHLFWFELFLFLTAARNHSPNRRLECQQRPQSSHKVKKQFSRPSLSFPSTIKSSFWSRSSQSWTSTRQTLNSRLSTPSTYVPDIVLPPITVPICSRLSALTSWQCSCITLPISYTMLSRRNTTTRRFSRSGWRTAVSFCTSWSPIDTSPHLACKRRKFSPSAFKPLSRTWFQSFTRSCRRRWISFCRRTSTMIRLLVWCFRC